MVSYDEADIAFFTELGTIVTTVVGGIGVGIGYGSNQAIVKKEYNKDIAKLEASRTQLSQTIAKRCDVSNFDIASVELAEHDKGYLLKTFGSTSVEEIAGLKQNNYLNIFMDIQNSDAFKILNALEKLEGLKRVSSYDSPEHNATINETKASWNWNPKENKNIRNAMEACQEVYSALNDAVINAQNKKIESVTEASSMNNSISKAYRVMKPETVTDTTGSMSGLFAAGHVSTAFVNAGIMTTSVSQVFKDEDKNMNYFYIDTLQGIPRGDKVYLESCRALVGVEGTELTQEEVYAKFIEGQHKSFIEVVREKQGSKTGIVDNELTDNVDEIELL